MAKQKILKPPVQTNRRHMVSPVNVTDLMDKIGGTRTAAALGVSTTLLYKAKKENAINKVVEVAAASALENLSKPRHATTPSQQAYSPAQRGGEVTFFVTIAADKADMFQRMAAGMGAAVVSA